MENVECVDGSHRKRKNITNTNLYKELQMSQYFQPYHYAAFEGDKPYLDGDGEPARQERLRVKESLMWIGDQLSPWIAQQNPKWDLHCHRQKEHYVSSFHFVPAMVTKINAMWLHFGKSIDQLDYFKNITRAGYSHRDPYTDDYNAFYRHTRIQIFINENVVRCWLLLATDNNFYDRNVYRKKLNDPVYFNRLWSLMQPLLNKEYFYEIDGERYELDSNATPQDLRDFMKKDHDGVYTGIVKEYQPDDQRISTTKIIDEMKENIELLYPVYDHMAYRP